MLELAPYRDQARSWPGSGRHILAQFDQETIVVYQAYGPVIADGACREQRLSEGFSLSRMSWIKPNFLWMMYRSGWATKPGQERVLAIRLPRAFFDGVLARAVASSHDPGRHATRDEWARALKQSEVRLQWDPDHDPSGAPVTRRALQLGLRGAVLAEYVGEGAGRITDVTELVVEQRSRARAPFEGLETPLEREYIPDDPAAREAIGLG